MHKWSIQYLVIVNTMSQNQILSDKTMQTFPSIQTLANYIMHAFTNGCTNQGFCFLKTRNIFHARHFPKLSCQKNGHQSHQSSLRIPRLLLFLYDTTCLIPVIIYNRCSDGLYICSSISMGKLFFCTAKQPTVNTEQQNSKYKP